MKNIYLLQRGKMDKRTCKETGRISDIIRMDYMGSSEFEFGTLPKSLRAMAANTLRSSNLQVRSLDVEDRYGRKIQVIGLLPDDLSEYNSKISNIVSEEQKTGYSGLIERTEFEDLITPLDKLPYYHSLVEKPPVGYRRGAKKQKYLENVQNNLTRFWWDLNNNVMVTFEPDLAPKIPAALIASWDSINPSPDYAVLDLGKVENKENKEILEENSSLIRN